MASPLTAGQEAYAAFLKRQGKLPIPGMASNPDLAPKLVLTKF